MKNVILCALLALCPALAGAASAPTPGEVQKVLDYYYGPSTAPPILIDTRICRDVVREGDRKNECTETIGPQGLEVGEAGYLWLNFIVPRDAGNQKILIQFEHEGVTRLTRQVDVSSAIRFRTWKKFALDRPGTWSVKILHDRPEGVQKLKDLTLGAKPPVVTSSSD